MPPQTTTHASLLARLAEGTDPSVWREFCDRYGELIGNFGRRRGLQPADCDDLIQEVLLSLSRAMSSFEYDPDKGKFRNYLKTVTRHAIFKILRQKGAAAALPIIDAVADPAARDDCFEATWDEEWRAHHVRRAMQMIEVEFTAAQLRAFQHYAVEGQEPPAVAQALNLTVNQVYQAKSRILKRLAELVQEQVRDEG